MMILHPLHRSRGLPAQAGMTLVEAIVWVAVFIMIMFALTISLIYFYKTNSYSFQEAEAINAAQSGMNTAVEALRTASYSNNGSYPIVSIAPNQITFYASVIPGDPLIQQVSLYVLGTSLYESLIEPSGDPLTYPAASTTVDTLSPFVQNLTVGTSTFAYYDQNGNPITNYANFQNVRFVTITLIADVSSTSMPAQLTLTSSAALRNLIYTSQ